MVTEIFPSYYLFSSDYYRRSSKQILTLEGHFLSFVGAAKQSSAKSGSQWKLQRHLSNMMLVLCLRQLLRFQYKGTIGVNEKC